LYDCLTGPRQSEATLALREVHPGESSVVLLAPKRELVDAVWIAVANQI
jgi:hypothetical protein